MLMNIDIDTGGALKTDKENSGGQSRISNLVSNNLQKYTTYVNHKNQFDQNKNIHSNQFHIQKRGAYQIFHSNVPLRDSSEDIWRDRRTEFNYIER